MPRYKAQRLINYVKKQQHQLKKRKKNKRKHRLPIQRSEDDDKRPATVSDLKSIFSQLNPSQSAVEDASNQALSILSTGQLDVHQKARAYTAAQKKLQSVLRMPDSYHSNSTPLPIPQLKSMHATEGQGGSLDVDSSPPDGEPVKERLTPLDIRDRADYEFFVKDSLRHLTDPVKKTAHKLLSILQDKLHMPNTDTIAFGSQLKLSRNDFRDYVVFLNSDKDAVDGPEVVSKVNNAIEKLLPGTIIPAVTNDDVHAAVQRESGTTLDVCMQYLNNKEAFTEAVKSQLQLKNIRDYLLSPVKKKNNLLKRSWKWFTGRSSDIDRVVEHLPDTLLREEAKRKLYTLQKMKLMRWNEEGEIIDEQTQQRWKGTNVQDIVEFWFRSADKIRHNVEFRPKGADEFLAKLLALQSEMAPPESPLRRVVNAETKLVRNGVHLVSFFYGFYKILNGAFGFNLYTWLVAALSVTDHTFETLAKGLGALGPRVALPQSAARVVQEAMIKAGQVADSATQRMNAGSKIAVFEGGRRVGNWCVENSQWLFNTMAAALASYSLNRRR